MMNLFPSGKTFMKYSLAALATIYAVNNFPTLTKTVKPKG